MRTGNPICGNPRNLRMKDAVGLFALLTGANIILRQRGVTLVQNGESHILNQTNWLDHVDVLSTNAPSIDEMMDSTNSMGQAVELYFVRSLDGGGLLGACRTKGIAVATRGDAVVIAHEVLHSCGTDVSPVEDIYMVEDPSASPLNPVPGLASQNNLPSDWGGGYYPPTLTQRELIGRLIMRSGGEEGVDTATPRDLPSGTIYGWKHSIPTDGTSPMVLGQASVGQSAAQRTPESY